MPVARNPREQNRYLLNSLSPKISTSDPSVQSLPPQSYEKSDNVNSPEQLADPSLIVKVVASTDWGDCIDSNSKRKNTGKTEGFILLQVVVVVLSFFLVSVLICVHFLVVVWRNFQIV